MVHKPNQPVTLANTRIVEIDGRTTHEAAVTVRLQVFPNPIVEIESDELPPKVFDKERFGVVLADGQRFEAILRTRTPGTRKGTLAPVTQPVTVIDKRVPLREVHFSIFNFPTILGKQTKHTNNRERGTAIPHTLIEASGWTIEMMGVLNIWDVEKRLNRERGFGVTYNGRIRRLDGAVFTVEEVETLLNALRVFLSFARGAWCSFASAKGKDENGNQSWLRWGARYVAPWNGNRLSWFRSHGGDDILSDLFPKFWNLIASGDGWEEALFRAIDWYLISNESALHVGIILNQAALERLSCQILQRRKKSKEPAGRFLCEAFQVSNLDPQIPRSCTELKGLQKAHAHCWENGLHLLVDIRNDLIHPTTKRRIAFHHAHLEAWNLGQWFIEMLLLRSLDYQGEYYNRLTTQHNDKESFVLVPWAQRGQGGS
ncbi:MAG: hypothetical protein OXI44_03485 [Bacteroidota bacterium]|nr:hypothetical protein [Bacteroidota bacterium]